MSISFDENILDTINIKKFELFELFEDLRNKISLIEEKNNISKEIININENYDFFQYSNYLNKKSNLIDIITLKKLNEMIKDNKIKEEIYNCWSSLCRNKEYNNNFEL